MEISKVLELASQILTVILLLSAAIGFVFRTWIAEWIKSKFSKAVNQELEIQKHQLNIELEAYKGSVIRDMEHYKANIDIKRSIALKMADARLESLRLLYVKLQYYANEAISMTTMNLELRQHNVGEYLKCNHETKESFRSAGIFLPSELAIQINIFLAAASKLVNDFSMDNEAFLLPDDPQVVDLRTKYVPIAKKLRDMIYETPALMGD